MYKWASCVTTRRYQVDQLHFEAATQLTLADAILDRLVHNSYRMELDGLSLRKTMAGAQIETGTKCNGLDQTSRSWHQPKANGVAGHLLSDAPESWPDVIGMLVRIKSESPTGYSGMRTVAKTIHTNAYALLIDRIIKARLEAGLSQQAVADRIGKPQSYVAKVERMERRLDVIEYFELAEAIAFDPIPQISAVWSEYQGQ